MKANDRISFMTSLDKCIKHLEEKGFEDSYKVEDGRLLCLNTGNAFIANDIRAVNFYRFEGVSDPDDMSVLYAIETMDGRLGLLIDAYGCYADTAIGDFMRAVEIHKHVHNTPVY